MKYIEAKEILDRIWGNVINPLMWNNKFADSETLNKIKKFMFKELDKFQQNTPSRRK